MACHVKCDMRLDSVSGDESNCNRECHQEGHGLESFQLHDSGNSSSTDHSLQLEIGICSTTVGGIDVLEIIMASPVPRGHEIHNTYGEVPNSELVSKYGFALLSNPFDSIALNKKAVIKQAKTVVGTKETLRRARFLTKERRV